MKTVVSEPLLSQARHSRRRDGAAESRRIAKSRVVDQYEQDIRRTFGWRRRHVDRPIGDRGIYRPPHRPAKVWVGDWQHCPVRAELPHRLGEGDLQCRHPFLVAWDDGPKRRALQRLLDAEPLLVIEDRNDPRRPRRQVLADVVVDLVVDAVIDELSDYASRYSTDSDSGQQGRREHSHCQSDAASPAHALAAHVVAGLTHCDAAVLRVRDEDDALDRDLLVLDQRDQPVKVLRRFVDVLVARNEDVSGCLSHLGSPSIQTAVRG